MDFHFPIFAMFSMCFITLANQVATLLGPCHHTRYRKEIRLQYTSSHLIPCFRHRALSAAARIQVHVIKIMFHYQSTFHFVSVGGAFTSLQDQDEDAMGVCRVTYVFAAYRINIAYVFSLCDLSRWAVSLALSHNRININRFRSVAPCDTGRNCMLTLETSI